MEPSCLAQVRGDLGKSSALTESKEKLSNEAAGRVETKSAPSQARCDDSARSSISFFCFFFFSLISFPKIWETIDMTIDVLLLSQVFSPDSVYSGHRGGVLWFKRKISLMTETIHAVGIKILRKVGRDRQPQNYIQSPVQTQGSPILSH